MFLHCIGVGLVGIAGELEMAWDGISRRATMRWMDDMEGLPPVSTRFTTTDGFWVSRRRVLNFCLQGVAEGVADASAASVEVVRARYSIVPEEEEAVRNVLQTILVHPLAMREDVIDDDGYAESDQEEYGGWLGRDQVRPDSPRGPPPMDACVDELGETYRWTLPAFGTAGLYGVPVHWRRKCYIY